MSLSRALQQASRVRLASHLRRTCIAQRQCLAVTSRQFHASANIRDRSFTNILADETPPAVQVKSISDDGIQLMDGLIMNSSCIFLEGKVFLWNVPNTLWSGWEKEHFEIFETVVPRPEILLLGTGKTAAQLPPALRTHLNQLGIQVDTMDTRNACSTYNILAEEGRRVAAALLPISPQAWAKSK